MLNNWKSRESRLLLRCPSGLLTWSFSPFGQFHFFFNRNSLKFQMNCNPNQNDSLDVYINTHLVLSMISENLKTLYFQLEWDSLLK